jgi:ATP-binding cassette, subfamily B, heavy metal transporter
MTGSVRGLSSPASPGDQAWIAGRLLSLLWPRGEFGLKSRVAGAVALVIVAKLIGVGAPWLYKQVVDTLSTGTVAVVPILLIVAYGLAHVGVQAVGALRQLVFVPVSQRAVRLTALRVFDHLHALSLRFHMERRTGGLSHIVQRGIAGIEYLLELLLFNILPTLLELALVSAILWRFYDAGFALAIMVTILCYAGFTIAVTRWQVRYRREMNERDVSAAVKAVDSILNYETVKYFGAEAHEAERYGRARRAYERAAIRSTWAESMFAIGQAVIIASGLIAIMIMAGRGVAGGTMSVGDFVLVVSYLLQLYAPLGLLGTVYSNVKQSLADIEAMSGLLAQPPEIRDRPEATALAAPRGHIVFDNISFAYDSRRPILEDVSFEVPPGQTVALVGPSGGGKSTLARLLFRFYDVGAGTRDEVEEAARLARLHDFIIRMPDGYESRVGERGLKLSGGEKQRVAIARVILKRPSILLFDEATSALDSHTEREIQASLRAVSAKRSTLVIAHRLSTIVEADEILVLEGGRIAERGRHDALLAQGGLYATLWSRQHRSADRETATAG